MIYTRPVQLMASREWATVVNVLSSVVGLTEWVDYLPVKLEDTSYSNSFSGHMNIVTLSDYTGYVAGRDYLNVYVDASKTKAWSYDSSGYIPMYYDPYATDFPGIANSEFFAPLTHSLILTRGSGNPTYTRATAAGEFDNEGKLINVPSGAGRFGGARMVRNLVTSPSNTLASGSANTVTLTAAGTYTFSMGAGTGTATFSGTSGASGTLAAGSGRVEVTKTVTAGTFIITASVAALVDIQLENVTGQADQTASEYVSVGVLSAPYHGAGTDGCKWFNTNKDGSSISSASLLGYHAEGARTNNLLYSRELSKTIAWAASATGSDLMTNGGFADATDWTVAGGWSISGGVANCSAASDGWLTHTNISSTYHRTVVFTITVTSGQMKIDGGQYLTASGTYAVSIPVGSAIRFYGSSFVGTLDNVELYISAIQPTLTATGIDNAANSATTLTATAADATILQTLSLAAAARSFSAYVKRRTGSGNIYITRDGGTTWTDVTSQINSSTWTRVKIENTSVLNPSCGFKIATSGDAIDVDVCQDEAGSEAWSPIITTTASVTRNADAETFPTASNWSDTAGWALATVQGESWANATGTAIGNGTNGLKLSASNSGIVAYDGTNTVNGPAGSPSGAEKLAMTWGGGALQAASGGVAGTAGSYDGAWGLATIGIGTSQGNVYIKDVYIGQSALTPAQIAQVTTP